MDFYRITERAILEKGVVVAKEVYPKFKVSRVRDLMIQGKAFHAIWDEGVGLWSTDEFDVPRLIDEDLRRYARELEETSSVPVRIAYLSEFGKSWREFRSYLNHMSDNSKLLDSKVVWANDEVRKEDYASHRLNYALEPGDISAYDELISVLYDPEERQKLEWAIGAVAAGDAKFIQKFIVLYGPSGHGKSTVMNIIMRLFEGYCALFDAKALTSGSDSFATAAFNNNPLVGIQQDGDLSQIADNSRLNSIVSHEDMRINEKFKPEYTARVNAFLFMGTNKPVKITDAKSGVIRRLIDVQPSGNLIPEDRYHVLVNQVNFELGAIAAHCLAIYRSLGKDYYSGYRSEEMILQTDVFYNYIEHYFDIFKEENGVTLNQAWDMYKEYCEDSAIQYKLPKYIFREELRNYFKEFHAQKRIEDKVKRSWYEGFRKDKFTSRVVETHAHSLSLDYTESLLDTMLAGCPAQYSRYSESTKSEIPTMRWSEVETRLADLDSHRVHYVKPPNEHIVIDFDLKDDNGNKSAELNIAAASEWPPTYAEFSQGGAGIHLHYLYSGDTSDLSRVYGEGVEIKVFTGDSSLRRRLSSCNNVPVAVLNGGLPFKEKKVIDFDGVKTEKGLRALIEKNLRKEIHPATKPSVDFIHKILEDAYNDGIQYDVTNLRPKISAFAMGSSNQSDYCLKLVNQMKFRSEEADAKNLIKKDTDPREVIFDCEVFPNLFVLCWKYVGDSNVVRMINPTPSEMEAFLKMKLVGFYNKAYDNHIVYGRYMGLNNAGLYELSKKLIENERTAGFREAQGISYADIYDVSSVKKSLKRFQIDLGISHKELGMKWDEPVPEDQWDKVVEYCVNDVITTEIVKDSRKQDFVAREILADLSGLPVNESTQKHTSKIIFKGNRNPQKDFVYTNLAEEFPGYVYHVGKSEYRGGITGEGGYVFAEPGIYTNVELWDIASMHPTSIVELNMFGPYTKNFKELLDARIAIKRKDYARAKKMLGGILAKHLVNEEDAKDLAYALKIVINIVYGLTSARFPNDFRDPRNKDNIVAKRGALFMIDLKNAIQERGFQVIHIKTDSIKISNPTPELREFVFEYGRKYGYEFEHEKTYEKLCLINDAVYIAKEKNGDWTATGAQFAHPYVFKTLFTHERIEFADLCETKQVTTALYLDFGEDSGPVFVGKAGSFVPIMEGHGGGVLVREKDGAFHSASGAKGYFWLEAEAVKLLGKEEFIDMDYFRQLADKAQAQIEKFGDSSWFLESGS